MNGRVKASLDSVCNTQLLLFLYPFDCSSCQDYLELLRSNKDRSQGPEEQAEDRY